MRAPSAWSNAWRCDRHGPVHPFRPASRANAAALAAVVRRSRVPVWAPDPLLPGWTVTGCGAAGDERTGARATVVACTGPSPLGGPADLLLVAEEPGVGLGNRYAGLPGPDPALDTRQPAEAKVTAAGHPTPLWFRPAAPDRAAYVGEAKGLWLWAVLWPDAASLVLFDDVALSDLRDGVTRELVFGAPSPYLTAAPPTDCC